MSDIDEKKQDGFGDFNLVKDEYQNETDYNFKRDMNPPIICGRPEPYFVGTVINSPLLRVSSHLKSMLVLQFKHLNPCESYEVGLIEGARTLWEVQYVKNGALQGLIGRVSRITRYDQEGFCSEDCKAFYKITFDTSNKFSSKKITIDANNIRLIKLSSEDDEDYPIHPEDKPGTPIVVPPDAFNFLKRTYKDRYKYLRRIPNPLIMNRVVNGLSMFEGGIAIEELDPMYTKELKIMDAMFAGLISLRVIPHIMTKNVTTMNGTFSDCESAEFMYALDTSNVTNMDNMFRRCKKLRSIPQLDMSLVISATDMLKECEQLEEIYFKPWSLKIGLNFEDCNLTKQCVINIIKNLGIPRDAEKATIKFANEPVSEVPADYKYRFTQHEWDVIVKPAIEEKGWTFVGITICEENP